MGVQEAIIKSSKQEGRQEGEEIGIDKTLKVVDLIKEGKTVKEISKLLKLKKELVQKVKDKFQMD